MADEELCAVDVCDRPREVRAWCAPHYNWSRRHDWAEPTHELRPYNYDPGQPCSVDGCDRPARARGWCSTHYAWWCNHDESVPVHEIRDGYKDEIHLDDMSKTQIAWCAGLYEGEGSCGLMRGYAVLGIKMTDRDVLEKFVAYVGGRVLGPYENSGNRKDTFQVKYAGQQAIDLSLTLYPYLGKRRKGQIDKMIHTVKGVFTTGKDG